MSGSHLHSLVCLSGVRRGGLLSRVRDIALGGGSIAQPRIRFSILTLPNLVFTFLYFSIFTLPNLLLTSSILTNPNPNPYPCRHLRPFWSFAKLHFKLFFGPDRSHAVSAQVRQPTRLHIPIHLHLHFHIC